jgi:N utilization substance protein B
MDRLAFLDRIIIKMGMTELIYCPTIPVRVTMNEYIELAKEFSTERSKLFVNGLLDKFLIDLRAEGKINKEDVDQEEEEE